MNTTSLPKILLVDDRTENLFALEVILAHENYLCIRASSGQGALEILDREEGFAIILMDVQMPLMDGFETVELIRKNEKLKHVPIIFLTASMDTSTHIFKGYQAGAVDYMIKPLSPEILKAKVAVFVELHLKTHELLVQKELLRSLNNDVTAINRELAFQNVEKEKRATELSIANVELAFQNGEKEKREAELMIANIELAYQNEEKAKRAAELIIANTELAAFSYVSSHDLQEPLRKIQTFAMRILDTENENLSERGKDYFVRMQKAAKRMQQLIEDLLAFSHLSIAERRFENTDLNKIIDEVKTELKETIEEKHAIIDTTELCEANIIPFQFRQLMHNLMNNALKFSMPEQPPHITIRSRIENGSKFNKEKSTLPLGLGVMPGGLLVEKNYCHITVQDNGIGFEPHFNERIFEVFQKLHSREVYAGTGIGLAIVKKIVENHNGIIIPTSELKKGATFDIYIPAN